jgi:hypothetical protein
MNKLLYERTHSQENLFSQKRPTKRVNIKTEIKSFCDKTIESVNEFLLKYNAETRIATAVDQEFLFIKQYFCRV